MKTQAFSFVRVEGNLLTRDHLIRIKTRDKAVSHLSASDYGVKTRIEEEISRTWAHLKTVWDSRFTMKRPRVDTVAEQWDVTWDDWFSEVLKSLDFGFLQPRETPEIEGKTYPIRFEWGEVPIHVVGFSEDLEMGKDGTRRNNPHSILQEYLNRAKGRKWGILSNGLKVRILRENAASSRPNYVEFDLEGIMQGEEFEEFGLFWHICHATRFAIGDGKEPIMDEWVRASYQEGTRALDRMRDGVLEAIQILGEGFLRHPHNRGLVDRIAKGALNEEEYYRQLLRLVYRLLFLFASEDRDLLLAPETESTRSGRRLYDEWYSTRRLRDLSRRYRGSKHSDLYYGLQVVMNGLKDRNGLPGLSIPALNGTLWGPAFVPDIDSAEISNRDLLQAVRGLSFVELEGGSLQAVDYRNLGSEELGSVYESLLDFHPSLNLEERTLALVAAGGSERKTTGSYYTHGRIITQLLSSALTPVLEEAAARPEPEVAILALKIVDPAVGSGHFLVAAARRIAHRLAQIRTGDAEPAPAELRHAIRDVVSHCLYGVDRNPMAAELCKVNLWLEAMEPGKPLSFLEHRIKVGNSLLGATPELLEAGIPSAAYLPLEGDDVSVSKAYREMAMKQNQVSLLRWRSEKLLARFGGLAQRIRQIEEISDDRMEGLEQKSLSYYAYTDSPDYQQQRLVADAWCSSFFWPKIRDGPPPVSADTLRLLASGGSGVPEALLREVGRISRRYLFFHWHIEFPEVFGREGASGFDLVLGNPPWDTLSPDEKEFFVAYDPKISSVDEEGQEAIVGRLLGHDDIRQRWIDYRRDLYASVHFLKNSGRYVLFAPGNLGKGDFNVYRMFVELAIGLTRPGAHVAQVVPENFYSGANAMALRKSLLEEAELKLLLCFENTNEVWFKGIHSQTKFAIYVARKGGVTDAFSCAFRIRSETELDQRISFGLLRMPVGLVREFSPDALAIMELESQRDIEIVSLAYSRFPKFGDASAPPPQRRYMAEVHMGNDRDLFSEDQSGYPLIEGLMIEQYDFCARGYRTGRGRNTAWVDLPFGEKGKSIQPQWHIPKSKLPSKLIKNLAQFRVGFRDVTNATNSRTTIASLIPPGVLCGHSVPTITFEQGFEWGYLVWLAVANSFVLDFLARKKVALHMSYTVLDSLPFPRPSKTNPVHLALIAPTARLSCAGPESAPFAEMVRRQIPSVRNTNISPALDPAERDDLRAALDAIVAKHLFGLSREVLAGILDTFPIIAKRQRKLFGDFVTKTRILELYDKLPPAGSMAFSAPA